MAEYLTLEGVRFLRLVLACICGGIIGYERKNRGKGAGIRTHIIVALASALMMIISKYGFADTVAGTNGIRGADSARIAAQVVSGVGFLGAGMIYFNRHSVMGLTTAAGIWATAGVGLAIGAGLYPTGVAATFLIVIFQIILHKNIKFLSTHNEEEISIVVEDTAEAYDFTNDILTKYKITVFGIKCARDNGKLEMIIAANIPSDFSFESVLHIFKENDFVKSIDIR